MASLFPGTGSFSNGLALPGGRRLARGMSRHAAGAMTMFAIWQAWLASSFAHLPGGAIFPWAALGLLLVGAIPMTRRLERRWYQLAADSFPCQGLLRAYRRDRALVWGLAIIMPPLWLSAVWLLASIF